MQPDPRHPNTIHADSIRAAHLTRAEQARLVGDSRPPIQRVRTHRLRAVLIALRRPDLVFDPGAEGESPGRC